MDELRVAGAGGWVGFDGSHVTVVRTGVWNTLTGVAGSHRLALADIAEVRMVSASLLKGRGFIQFLRRDDPMRQLQFRSYGRRDEYNAAALDEFSLAFGRREQAGFLRLKGAVEEALGLPGSALIDPDLLAGELSTQPRSPAPVVPAAAPVPVDLDVVEKLHQLAELHALGELDDAEFAAAKSRLLGTR